MEKKYTAEQQKQMAADLAKAPPSIQSAVVDYGQLRDKARACRGEMVPGVSSSNALKRLIGR